VCVCVCVYIYISENTPSLLICNNIRRRRRPLLLIRVC
jgi:hypothetical protein